MNYIIGLIILSVFLMTGCKEEEVKFNAVQSAGRQPIVPVEPVGPQGPVVKIVQGASDHKLNEETQLMFAVTPGDFEIAEVECFIDQLEISCDWLTGIVELKDFPLGLHLFEVVATDVEGLTGSAKDNWSVLDRFKRVKDNLNIKAGPKKADILFVIDNSSSMSAEQKKISQRFDKFIEQVSGLDWHIGVTTTDTRDNPVYSEAWNDGKLHPFKNGDAFLTPALGEKKAQEMFAKHVKRTESYWDTEKGIKATFRAVERASKPRSKADQDLVRFFRDDAALAVVVVSDENETGDDYESDPDNLIAFVEEKMGKYKVFQFNSIITHTWECLHGSGASMGVDYEDLSRKTNGVVGDICADNYSEILQSIGKGVSDLQKTHKLQCQPLDINKDGNPDMVVKGKAGAKVPGYVIDEDKIVFDSYLKPGDYQFLYFCFD